MEKGVRRPLHSVRSGIVWPSDILRGNLVLLPPGIARIRYSEVRYSKGRLYVVYTLAI